VAARDVAVRRAKARTSPHTDGERSRAAEEEEADGVKLTDINGRIAEYREAVEAIALRVSRGAVAIQVGAEYDDLVQEGLINVWQTLERGIAPSADMIENRMRDYSRWLGKQIGRGRDGSVPYEALLPLDHFVAAHT
jgi:capsular polysaccharide biosynthesis protein